MLKKRILATLLGAAMLLTLAACGSKPAGNSSAPNASGAGTNAPAAAFGGTLNVGISDALGSFQQGANQGDCWTGIYLVFDALFYHDTETKEVYSYILDDWYYEDDLTFVMKLKDGVYFSNGQKATSEDVLYSLTNYAQRRAMTASMFSGVDAENSYCPDELTTVVKFREPWGPGIFSVDSPLFCKSWCEEVGWDSQDWLNCPVGSGPYKVTGYVTDSKATLALRDDFWGDETMYNPDIKEITLNYYPEIATMFIDLQTGAIDLALNIAEADYARGMNGIDGITVERISTNETEFLCMDTKNQYLKDENVRLAIAYGVDWSVVADAGFGSLQAPATSILSSESPYYKDCGGYPYDLDKAKDYLAASGYSGEELTFKFVAMADADQQNMAEAFQFYMNQLGMTVNIEYLDFASALGTWMEEGGTDFNFQESATGSLSGEPYISLNALMTAYGNFAICTVDDDQFNQLAERAMKTIDRDERAAAFAELQTYAHDHAWVIPMLEGYYALGYDNTVISAVDFGSAIGANLRHVTLAGQ